MVGNDMWVVGKVEFGDFALERHRSNSPVGGIRRKRPPGRPSRPRHIGCSYAARRGTRFRRPAGYSLCGPHGFGLVA